MSNELYVKKGDKAVLLTTYPVPESVTTAHAPTPRLSLAQLKEVAKIVLSRLPE